MTYSEQFPLADRDADMSSNIQVKNVTIKCNFSIYYCYQRVYSLSTLQKKKHLYEPIKYPELRIKRNYCYTITNLENN